MAPLFIYLLKSGLSLGILVIFYELVQKREVFFNFNRVYLLLGMAIALLLPFWNFNFLTFFTAETASHNFLLTYQVSHFQLPEVLVGTEKEAQTGFSLVSLLFYVYLAGVLFKLARLMFQTIKLNRLIKKTRTTRSEELRFIFTDGDLPVFSFFNNIFISENTFSSSDSEKIIAHEKVHISQLHSLDLLFAELVCIVQWFNPFAYLLKKAIRENHEFLADEKVISAYSDPSTYRLLLLTYSSGIKTNSLAHNFSYSLLKRRLFMTTKPKKRMRLGLSISAAGIAFLLVLFACSQPDQNITEISEVKDISMMDDVYENVEIMPEYPGGMESLITFLGTNISYPDEAKEKGIEGKVFVGFIIDKEGSVREVKAKNKIGYGCDEEAVRVISLMPNWKPGYLDDKAVNVSYTIPISFALDSKEEKDSVFTVVKQMPEFPGGLDALMQYLGANIKYPEQAKKDSIQGRVFVSFVVEKDGKIDEVKVLRGIGSGCDKESVRVISTMPDWTPGRNENGEAVRVAYNIPIKFALN